MNRDKLLYKGAIIMTTNNVLLESRKGHIMSTKEWKEECDRCYKDIGKEDIADKWERFGRILGLQEVGKERGWDSRKPCTANREGLTHAYEHE